MMRGSAPEAVATLMAQLPPFDWTEIATKRDLDLLERNVVASIRAEFRGELNAAITAQTRTKTYTALGAAFGSSLTTGSLVLAATQLT